MGDGDLAAPAPLEEDRERQRRRTQFCPSMSGLDVGLGASGIGSGQRGG
jgi:hypothetical protein